MCEVDQYRLRLLKTNSPLNLLEGREKISTCNSQSLPLFPHLKARLGLVALSQSLAPTTAPSQPRGPWVIIFLAFQVFLNRNTATRMPRAKAICIPLFQGKTQGRFWKQGDHKMCRRDPQSSAQRPPQASAFGQSCVDAGCSLPSWSAFIKWDTSVLDR